MLTLIQAFFKPVMAFMSSLLLMIASLNAFTPVSVEAAETSAISAAAASRFNCRYFRSSLSDPTMMDPASSSYYSDGEELPQRNLPAWVSVTKNLAGEEIFDDVGRPVYAFNLQLEKASCNGIEDDASSTASWKPVSWPPGYDSNGRPDPGNPGSPASCRVGDEKAWGIPGVSGGWAPGFNHYGKPDPNSPGSIGAGCES